MPRFNLRTMLIIVSLFCVGMTIVAITIQSIAAGGRGARLQHFQSILSNDPRIERVSIEGYEEEFGLFTVTTVSFQIRGRPDSSIALFVADGEKNFNALRIYQIGNLGPVILEWDADAAAWAPRSPAIGDSNYRPPSFPWETMTVSDLVSHYDELIDYFSAWPVHPNYGSFTTDGKKEYRYFIESPGCNLKDQFIPGK